MLVYQRVIGYKWIWYHMISYDIMKYHWWAASEHGVFHGTPALMAIWIANMMIKQWIWMYLLFRKCHVIFFYIMLIIRWIIPYEIGLTCFYSKHFEACFYSCMNFTYGFFKVQHLITSPCRPKFAIGNVSVSSGGDVSVRSCDVHLRVARPRGLRGPSISVVVGVASGTVQNWRRIEHHAFFGIFFMHNFYPSLSWIISDSARTAESKQKWRQWCVPLRLGPSIFHHFLAIEWRWVEKMMMK